MVSLVLEPTLLLIHHGCVVLCDNDTSEAEQAQAVVDLRNIDTAEPEQALRSHGTAKVEQAQAVNLFEVVVGVHSASLTNAVFLVWGGVLMQVVLYEKTVIARAEFREPAMDLAATDANATGNPNPPQPTFFVTPTRLDPHANKNPFLPIHTHPYRNPPQKTCFPRPISKPTPWQGFKSIGGGRNWYDRRN